MTQSKRVITRCQAWRILWQSQSKSRLAWTCRPPTQPSVRTHVAACLLTLVCLCQLGCGGSTANRRSYGQSTYPDKYASINGLGVFEKLCLQAGIRFVAATRLSPRLEKVECILMIGDTFKPPAKEARDWLEEWLARQPGRSVIYVGRDFDAEVYYREKTLVAVPAERQARAAIELATVRSQHDSALVHEIDKDVFCRWFVLRVSQPLRAVSQFTGPWSEALKDQSATWPVRAILDLPLPEYAENKPTWTPAPVMTVRPPFGSPPARRKTQDQSLIFTSYWSYTDINDDETWENEWAKAPLATSLLASEDGTPLVTRLTSDLYPDGQILTLVNAAPLLNGSLVEPHFRQMAHQLIGELGNTKRIAVLPLNGYGIQVSRVPDEEDEIAGLSVLTTWPMNMIIAHLAFLGILFCLALFPILGRPQALPQVSVTDFGQHAEALGQMLRRTRDTHFALQIIGDYFRSVRGEALPAWLKSEALPGPASTGTASTGPASTGPASAGTASTGPASANAVHAAPVNQTPLSSQATLLPTEPTPASATLLSEVDAVDQAKEPNRRAGTPPPVEPH